ncbi:MAG: ComEA family DNA-binding protein, partial [Burkholderiales bacterium]
ASPAGAIDLNQADEAQLLAIKGLGPTRVRALLDERQANGPFVDADDVAARVKGIGPKTVARLQAEGLAIGAEAVGAEAGVHGGAYSGTLGGAIGTHSDTHSDTHSAAHSDTPSAAPAGG